MTSALAAAFYGAMFVALMYFVHKVLWFVKLRRLQEALVMDAERRVRDATSEAMSAWDRAAATTWSSGASPDEDAVAHVRRVEARLLDMDALLKRGGRKSVRDWFIERTEASVAVSSADAARPESLAVLTMPRTSGDAHDVTLTVGFPRVRRPTPPPSELYELQVRSRYGVWRRALAFVLGAADVVYSSSHVARMSQNVQVPVSVLVRRLSLVALILLAIGLDIAFGLRVRLIEQTEAWLGPAPHLPSLGGLGPELDPHLATTLALGGWLAAYGAIYFGLYLFLRRRSQVCLRRLEAMRERRQDDLDAIYEHHRGALTDWAAEYAGTLDDAVGLCARQARLLVGRTTRRVRRRVASDALSAACESAAQRLFELLPESSAGLQDVATRHQHSFKHELWPRVSEMGYQVELARTRAAWRRLESARAELRGERPDPAYAHGTWRTLAVIFRMFPEVFDEEETAELEERYKEAVAEVVEATEQDLAELDRRLSELEDGLREQLSVASALFETQIELAEQAMEVEVAELSAELLEVREGARLEAMAFEI